MARRYILKEREVEYAESLDQLIPRLLQKHRTVYFVAVELKVYPNAIRNWLHDNGYQRINGEWSKRHSSVQMSECQGE